MVVAKEKVLWQRIALNWLFAGAHDRLEAFLRLLMWFRKIWCNLGPLLEKKQHHRNYSFSSKLNSLVTMIRLSLPWISNEHSLYKEKCWNSTNLSNRPRSLHQYSNMALRLSGQTSIFGGVFFVSKSLLGIVRQKKPTMLEFWYMERGLLSASLNKF